MGQAWHCIWHYQWSGVCVCVGGGVTSIETRLSVPDFVSQLWRKFGDKIRNGSLGLSHASLVPRLSPRLSGEPGNEARDVQIIGVPRAFLPWGGGGDHVTNLFPRRPQSCYGQGNLRSMACRSL